MAPTMKQAQKKQPVKSLVASAMERMMKDRQVNLTALAALGDVPNGSPVKSSI